MVFFSQMSVAQARGFVTWIRAAVAQAHKTAWHLARDVV
jgi:hypothetical protein